ncbi:MAG: hypothetical protein M5U19_12675 [Microthrixaceae bacterium]|nr:hypothetical protein [Microthrixaceae bacterium]
MAAEDVVCHEVPVELHRLEVEVDPSSGNPARCSTGSGAGGFLRLHRVLRIGTVKR